MVVKKKLLFLANTLSLTLAVLPALCQGDASSAVPATTGDTASSDTKTSQSMQLNGGVEQKEVITIPSAPATANRKALPQLTLEIPKLDAVPPVPKFLQAGTSMEQASYPKEGNIWYKIPQFLAGNWACNEKTITSSINQASGRENDNARVEPFVSEIHQGFQKDSSGQTWQFDQAPFLGHSIEKGETHFSFVQMIEPLLCTEEKFVRRVILIKAQVDGSNVVKTAKQFELVQTFSPFGADKIREDNVSRPIGQSDSGWKTTSTTIFSLTKPYVPVNQSNGRDMKEMFREYLEDNGLSNLVPKP